MREEEKEKNLLLNIDYLNNHFVKRNNNLDKKKENYVFCHRKSNILFFGYILLILYVGWPLVPRFLKYIVPSITPRSIIFIILLSSPHRIKRIRASNTNKRRLLYI